MCTEDIAKINSNETKHNVYVKISFVSLLQVEDPVPTLEKSVVSAERVGMHIKSDYHYNIAQNYLVNGTDTQ